MRISRISFSILQVRRKTLPQIPRIALFSKTPYLPLPPVHTQEPPEHDDQQGMDLPHRTDRRIALPAFALLVGGIIGCGSRSFDGVGSEDLTQGDRRRFDGDDA